MKSGPETRVGRYQILTMLRFCAWLLISISWVATQGRAQQVMDVAYFELVRVKPDSQEQFETTLKRHWGWHEKMGEKWSYFVWSVDTGKNEGSYEIASFGHTWKEVDESNALVAGTPGPGEDTEPYHKTVQESYYRYRPELSTASPVKQRLPVASVTQILLRPEGVHDFEVALRQVASVECPYVVSAQWYELVTGGERPQFLLIEERPDWASFRNNGELDALREEACRRNVGEDIVKNFWSSIRSVHAETWQYRSDLSRLAGSK